MPAGKVAAIEESRESLGRFRLIGIGAGHGAEEQGSNS
jgi:hypothetical protein